MTDFYELPTDLQVHHLMELCVAALPMWGIGKAGIKLLKYRENAVFGVVDLSTGVRYAMRVHRYNYHSDEALVSELGWMQALRDADIHPPEVISTKDGELFTRIRHGNLLEERQVDLLSWVEGEPIGTIENDQAVTAQAVRANHKVAGQLAARIHNQSETWVLPADFVRPSWDEEGLLCEGAHLGCFWKLELLSDDQRSLLLKARDVILKKLAAFGKGEDRYGLTHADFLPENLMSDGKDISIIDFDDCGFGWHLMDISTSLFFLIGEDGYEPAREGLIEGYRSRRSLPDSHLDMLPTFLLARGLTYLGWVHSRSETETAQAMASDLIEGVCAMALEYSETEGNADHVD